MRFNTNPKFPVSWSVVRLASYGYLCLESTTGGAIANPELVLHQVDTPVVEMSIFQDVYDNDKEELMEFCSGYSTGGCSSW